MTTEERERVLDAFDSFELVLRRLSRNRFPSPFIFYVLVVLPMWTAGRTFCVRERRRMSQVA